MTYTPATWRLLYTPPARGAWNMAVDEALLEAVGRGESLPVLRLYAWTPPCLSLGYAQPAADVDQDRLASLGWDLVRRPTGGRAILHTDELTYSVIGPPDEPRLAGSVLESYRCLSQALLRALHLLDIPALALPKHAPTAAAPATPAPERPSSSHPKNPVCFEVPSNYEITVEGKKLIGSAQARRKEGVLQHGSLPLFGDLTRITQALVFSTEEKRQSAADRLLQRAATAETVLGHPLAWEAAARAFASAFEEVLDLRLEPSSLSPAELSRAQVLVDEKYADPHWNLKDL